MKVEKSEARCQLCGELMPEGEEMFNYHGYSCPCPKPPADSEPILVALKEWDKCIGGNCSASEGNAFIDGYNMGTRAGAREALEKAMWMVEPAFADKFRSLLSGYAEPK